MKWTLWTRRWIAGALLSALVGQAALAADAAPVIVRKPAVRLTGQEAPAANAAEPSDTAKALQDHVNVRAKPGTASEVIAQLKKGQPVIVLEEIKLKKTNAPADWFKVALPGDKPVWIHNGFLSTNNVVVPKYLNLRSGPSEESQIVGRAAKGTKLKPLETKGDWTKIESPAVTYGYVAASLLKREAIAAAPVRPVAPVVTVPVRASPPITPVAPPVEPPPPLVVTQVQPPPITPMPAETVTPAPPVVAPPIPVVADGSTTVVTAAPGPVTNLAPITVVTAAPGTNGPVPPPLVIPPSAVRPKPGEAVPVDRLVAREGTVRATINIQAPADHELLSVHSGRLINYLHTTATNINLRPFRGKRVIVTGREVLDERWPLTPVLLIETVETVP